MRALELMGAPEEYIEKVRQRMAIEEEMRFSADRGRRIQRKMERARVPRRREAVPGFKNAPQLGQVGSFGLAHPIILTPAPKTRQLKKASGICCVLARKGVRMAGLRTRRNSAASKF